MTTPIKQQPQRRTAFTQPTVCALLRPAGMGCSLAAGHEPPCEPVHAPKPPTPPQGVSAAPPVVEPRQYGFAKSREFDLELPSGAYVRVRELRRMQVIDLKIVNILDGFAPELLKDISGDDPELAEHAQQEALKAIVDPETSSKVFGPVNRVVAAAVVCPKVVLSDATGDDEIHIDDVEIEDKMAIFSAAMPAELRTAALGEQLTALKSVRDESSTVV